VRAAATRALADRGGPAAVEALIPRLELEKNARLRWEAYTTLKDLTEQDFGFDTELWTLWAKGGRRSSDADARDYASPRFYGLRVLGERPVFVIDLSGSMLEPLELRPAERRRIEAAGDDARLDWSEVESKLDLAKAELAAALRSLDENARFGLIFYADSVVLAVAIAEQQARNDPYPTTRAT